MKLDGQRRLVLDLVHRRGTNLKAVSLAIGRNHAYLQQFMNRGKPRRLPEDARRALADYFEIDQEGLAQGVEIAATHIGNQPDHPMVVQDIPGYVPIQRVSVPVGMGGGGFMERDDPDTAFFAEQLILHQLRAKPRDIRYMELRGQSMSPVLEHGDQVLIDLRDLDPSQAGIFVLWDGEGLVCKWVSRVHGSEPPKLRLRSENTRFEPYEPLADECRIMGRVVWFARRI